KKGSAEINPDAIKTSAGALYKIPVCRQDSLGKTGRFLIDSGVQLVVSTEKTKDSVYDVDYTVPTCVIMGAEDVGVSDDLIRISDKLAKIPMFGDRFIECICFCRGGYLRSHSSAKYFVANA